MMDNYKEMFSRKKEVDKYCKDYINEDEKVYLKWLGKKDKVLDVGCSGGRWAFLMSPKVEEVDAIDVSEEMIKVAESLKKQKKIKNVNFIRKDILDFDTKKRYDFVFGTFNILTYPISDFERICILRKMIELTKDGGGVILSLTNRYWYKLFPKVIYYYLYGKGKFGDVYTNGLFQHIYSKGEITELLNYLKRDYNFDYKIIKSEKLHDAPKNMAFIVILCKKKEKKK